MQIRLGGGRIRGMKIKLGHNFEDLISLENLLKAWKEFLVGKRNRKDVQIFEASLMNNIFSLHHDLLYHRYLPGSYQSFKINDPKPRHIHKASVRDRLLHHAIYQSLYPFFDRTFIFDSYSCRLNKGTHKAITQFKKYFLKISHNNTRNCWVLKGDIRKFFASIDHTILNNILGDYILDKDILGLLKKIISSFKTGAENKGLPLGNLTSQLFANVYLNKFDQFVKHQLKVKYYIRYADDFVLMSEDKDCLKNQVSLIQNFLLDTLKLELHPNKLFLETISSGVDFLGWIHFPDHRVLRGATRRRMFRKINNNSKEESLNSYLGLLSHGNAKKLQTVIINKKSG